jgi:uncharacterized membrane protein YdbT with pleckstrin-like domain
VDDDIVYQARLHWVIFIWPIVIFILVVAVGLYFPLFRQPSLIFGILVALWGGATYGMYCFFSLSVKSTRVILQSGFLVRKILDIPLNKIESIDIRQNLMGGILGYGSLEITGTGGSRELVTYVSKPLTCRRYIEQMMRGQ